MDPKSPESRPVAPRPPALKLPQRRTVVSDTEIVATPPKPSATGESESAHLHSLMLDLGGRYRERGYYGLDSGFRALNPVINGLSQGLYVLLGPPTIGKTALAKQIADQVAQLNEVPVLFFTFVHSADDLRMRTLARIAGVELAEIMNGKTDRVMETFPKREMTRVWDLVEDAAKQYGAFGSRMQVIEAGRRTAFETLRQTAHDAKREAGADQILMVFDHLQAMPLAGGNSPDACGVDEICFDLRRLARSLNSPVLLVSSEAHEAYKGNRMPTLSALKSAEGMGYAADVILAMWEDQTISKRLTRESPGMRNVNLILLKNRRGNLAQFTAMFHPGTSRFMNLEKSDQPYDRFDAMQG